MTQTDEQASQSKFKKYVVLAIVGLVALTMLGFGLVDLTYLASTDIIKVEGKKVSRVKFQQYLENQKRQYIQYFGYGIAETFLNKKDFTIMAANQMADSLLILKMLEDNGIVIDGNTVKEYVLNHPQFQDSEGKFSKEYYENYLMSIGVSEEIYLSNQADKLGVEFLLNIFTLNEVAFMDNLALKLLKDDIQQREVQIAKFKLEYDIKTEITEDEIKSYYEEHKEEFKGAEERVVLLSKIDSKTFENSMTEREIEQAYKRDYLYKNSKVSFYRFSFNSQIEAEEGQKSLINSNALYLKDENYSDLDTPFKNAIADVKVGGNSSIFYAGGTYNIIKLEAITKAKTKPLSEVKNEIVNNFNKANSCALASRFAEKVNTELESGLSLDVIPDIKLKELTISREQTQNLPLNVANQINEDAETNYGKVIQANACEFYVYQISQIKPEYFKDVSAVKDRIKLYILYEKMEDKARFNANAYYGEVLEGVKQFEGEKALITKQDKSYTEEELDLIFKAEEGGLTQPTLSKNGGEFVIAKVVKVIDAKDGTITKEQIAEKVKALKAEQREQLLQAYLQELRKKYKVVINYDAL
jgi:hypothetical protein